MVIRNTPPLFTNSSIFRSLERHPVRALFCERFLEFSEEPGQFLVGWWHLFQRQMCPKSPVCIPFIRICYHPCLTSFVSNRIVAWERRCHLVWLVHSRRHRKHYRPSSNIRSSSKPSHINHNQRAGPGALPPSTLIPRIPLKKLDRVMAYAFGTAYIDTGIS